MSVQRYNFSAGPAMLPFEVMQQAREELLDWGGRGYSVMEISHRSPEFQELAYRIEADLRELYAVPTSYRVLFLAGGASHQFAMVPMNLVPPNEGADYLHTGHWSGMALREAQKYCRARTAMSAAESGFTTIPPRVSWEIDPASRYVYLALNETLKGLEFPEPPDCGELPLVADATSNFLSGPLDIGRFGLIFAGAQKNVAPAGMTVVIVHESLLGRARTDCPRVFNFSEQARERSMCNTPPTFNWYMAGLNFGWLKRQGGMRVMAERNRRKAQRLYACIDGSGLYENRIDRRFRSRMNVSFELNRSELEGRFVEEAEAVGLHALRGHSRIGGLRASVYNAMPEAGVSALVDFMCDFERRYG